MFVCYAGTEAYARALLRDCLKTMTPLLRRFHRLPASQERNNAVILTELCVAMNVVNEKSLLVLDKDVKKMMYEIGTRLTARLGFCSETQ